MTIIASKPLQAAITFSFPDSRLPSDIDPKIYQETHTVQRPKETINVPISNLRSELELPSELQLPVLDQMESRGFGVSKHESKVSFEELNEKEGIDKYLIEACE